MRLREEQETARAPRHAGPFVFSGLPRIGRALAPERATVHSQECPNTGQYKEATISRIRHLRIAAATAPVAVNRTVPPRRLSNAALRSREHLTPDEVERLVTAAGRRGRYGHRDSTLIMLAYRHGLRVDELVALRWEQVDLTGGLLHVARLKRGLPSTHPLRGPEIRGLRRLKREQRSPSPYVFATERRGPLTTAAVRKLVTRIGQAARFPFPVHPHMLRHACGLKLANEGHDTRAIQQWLGSAAARHGTTGPDR
jgi:integrase